MFINSRVKIDDFLTRFVNRLTRSVYKNLLLTSYEPDTTRLNATLNYHVTFILSLLLVLSLSFCLSHMDF